MELCSVFYTVEQDEKHLSLEKVLKPSNRLLYQAMLQEKKS